MPRSDNRFELRPGRIRSQGSTKRARSFLSRVSRSISRAGGTSGRVHGRIRQRGSYQGRRRVVVKARIVRLSTSSVAALTQHLKYIRRDSAHSPDDRGTLFDGTSGNKELRTFAERASEDRHHFRFIVSPEDGKEMSDLKPFVRDLMSQMEQDLDTPPDWVGAVHTDTGRPHAHIVIRGRRQDGSDLVMPRDYISYGVRECAEDLVQLELGPETSLERRQKSIREITSNNFTRLDAQILRLADHNQHIDLSSAPSGFKLQYAARLKHLGRLGLANKQSALVSSLNPNLKTTLQAMQSRRDIIKLMHKAMKAAPERQTGQQLIFDPADPHTITVTGAIHAKGFGGESHDTPFLILDGLDGRIHYVALGRDRDISELKRGMIVSANPHKLRPRPSDKTVHQIALENAGTYSETLHRTFDPKASENFIKSHIRRLEALRRAGRTERLQDGSWKIASDHLVQAEAFERAKASRAGTDVQIESHLPLSAQIEAIGAVWLDRERDLHQHSSSFANDVYSAIDARREFLIRAGYLKSTSDVVDANVLIALEATDLREAAATLSTKLGKPYRALEQARNFEGIYRKAVNRPSGRYAIIE